MANRYANLPGPAKISETYQDINTGFDRVEQEMDEKADGGDLTSLETIVDDHIGSRGNAHTNATQTEAGFMSAADKEKLNHIEAEAEKNQNAFAKVNDLEAESPSDELSISGGTGITVTTNPNTNEVNITATGESTPGTHGTSHLEYGSDPIPLATETDGGLMSAEDKQKLTDLEGLPGELDDLAGEGRTTETVKGNADALAVHQADVEKEFNERAINVLNPPPPLMPADRTGDTESSTAIQAIVNKVSADGGGKVFVPPGNYKLTNIQNRYALSIPSNVTLEGAGYGTYFFLDPSVVISPTVFMCILIGDSANSADNVNVKKIRLNGNQAAINGGVGQPLTKIILGIGSRLDEGALAILQYCSNITVEDCDIDDVNIGVFASKNTDINNTSQERIDAQHRNWKAINNRISNTTNKTIEFQETFGGRIAGNYCYNTVDGPQAINSSRDITIEDNHVFYRTTGINVTHNSKGIKVLNNYVECIASTGKAAMILRTEPYADDSVIDDVLIQGNTFVDKVSATKKVFIFETRNMNLSAQFKNISIANNTFNGQTYTFDFSELGVSEISDVRWSDNTFHSSVVTNAAEDVTKMKFKVNEFKLNFTHRSKDWTFIGNEFEGSVTLGGDTQDNVLVSNVIHGTLSDAGTNNRKNFNEVLGA